MKETTQRLQTQQITTPGRERAKGRATILRAKAKVRARERKARAVEDEAGGSETLWYGGVAGRYLGSWRVFKHKKKQRCQGNTNKKRKEKNTHTHTHTVFEILNPPWVEVRRSGYESASTNIASPEMFHATIVPDQKGETHCAVTSCFSPRHF